MSLNLYKKTSYQISKLITKRYSTSFSLATSLLGKEKGEAIYAVYGFVRLADEIVDTFHDFDKEFLLNKLNDDLNYALTNGISTNPILNAFQDTVNKFNISNDHISSFMKSMWFDLKKKKYMNTYQIDEYVYGSAETVGLMCLKIFSNGEEELYQKLEKPARSLGSAFQKVNFLRDLKYDIQKLNRTYFPELSNSEFNEGIKDKIIKSIEKDFQDAWIGIKHLPGKSKLAVLIAYKYYFFLMNKLKKAPAEEIISTRIRISNIRKLLIMTKYYFAYKLNIIQIWKKY